ncbi:Prolyl tripeptidyl peptidase precursor [Novipirellula artificiosorum]|uniref:Prolyl tripeptidyl peptidase n=2 Tax=Novipirellula artificiosorum TaxID=2528016 RepID=A0A5C6E4U4_9BACT|nr:Prolyl tripeptidyl peptidase precursor [Novipirellula artificiosorum]
MRYNPRLFFVACSWLVPLLGSTTFAQQTPAPVSADAKAVLTVDRIYEDHDFDAKSYSARWLDRDGPSTAMTTLEPSDAYSNAKQIVRHDAQTGETSTMVSASELVPPGESEPLSIDDYAWSTDQNRLLVFTNTKRVWRTNTRGDYWLLDRSSRQLRKLGGDGPASSMMFAKLSPNGNKVAFVRNRNLFVEDLVDHSISQLTYSDSDTVINGTTDWVYEEEFRLRDAFRWNGDGTKIAYWQIDTAGVEKFPLINNTDSLYPKVTWFAYPKAGTRNPICRIGVVDLESKATSWIELPGDRRDHYVPWIDWVPNTSDTGGASKQLLIQQLNRLQNTNTLFLADVDKGTVNVLLTETDDAWVDVHDELFWMDEGKRFTWISDRTGWRRAYCVDVETGVAVEATPGDFDVVELLKVDESHRQLYFLASPENATERYLYRSDFAGESTVRITPGGATGTHAYAISPNAKFAIHTHSSLAVPPVVELVSLPEHKTIRVYETNEELVNKLAELQRVETEFFRVTLDDGVTLDGSCIKPPGFDPTTQYPLLVYVYGEPAGTTVTNKWGGSTYLWHRMLAERGLVVMSFDNRGTNVPRGREFRKCVYRKIGTLGPADQADALRNVLEQRPYLDEKRVGIWGWSGGGSSTLHAMFKFPELYATGISVAPVPNQRYYDTIYQERYMGLPQSNVEGYRKGSPISFASQLAGNLLIIHGTGDDNCHYQTVEMLFDELIANDKPFSMMAYPNRSHSISERKNTTRHLRKLMTNYLEEHLLGTAR